MSYRYNDKGPDGSGKILSAWCVFALLLYGLHIAEAIAARSWLHADGVFYLLNTLENGWFVSWHGSRSFITVLPQIPLRGAMLAGIADLGVLSLIYGIGLYASYVLCASVCLWVSRGDDLSMPILIYFLFACAMNSDMWVSESHATAALFMSLVFLLLRPSSLGTPGTAVAILLSLPLLRAYESMMFFGPVLVGLCAWRIRSDRSASLLHRLLWLGMAAWLLAGSAIAISAFLRPRDPANYENFRESLMGALHQGDRFNVGGCLSVAALTLLVMSFVSWRWVRWVRVACVALFAAAVAAASIVVWRDPSQLGVTFAHGARVFNVFGPLVLAGVLVAVRFGMIRMECVARNQVVAVASLLACFQLWTGTLRVHQWLGYTELFRNEIRQSRGILEYDDTLLQKQRIGRQLVAEFNWGWTMPAMSIFLAPGGRVRTIIKNPQPVRWEPFDPEKPETLPKLGLYGITYDLPRPATTRP